MFHHSRWKLDWQSTKFKLLGGNFSLNVDEILDLNYNTRLIDIKNTLCKRSEKANVNAYRKTDNYENTANNTENESFNTNPPKPR